MSHNMRAQKKRTVITTS